MQASSTIPGNWQEFLCIEENKIELFSFLATIVTSMANESNKDVISIYNSDVLSNHPRDLARLAPCTHEEADTRIILHLEDAVKDGNDKLSFRTVDTDVVVLAVTAVQRLDVSELWTAFETGKHFRFLAAHEMARSLGPDRCIALPMFHSFNGCDTVSSFGGRGKKTAWDTWKVYEEVTKAFCSLMANPEFISDNMKSIERFVTLMYDRTSSLDCVDQARKQLFTQKGRSIEGLPPIEIIKE